MLVQLLLNAARARPRGAAVRDPFVEMDYGRLTRLAATFRRLILQESGRPNVGLMLPTTAAGTAAIYGALWARRAFVPLNFLLQPPEIARIVEDAGLDLVIATRHFEPLLAGVPVRTLYLENLGLKRRYLWSRLCRMPEPPDVDPDDPAAILYTSGTSGEPKGVCLTHRNLHGNAVAVIEHLRITPDHRLLGVLPTFHVFGLNTLVFLPVLLGTSVRCVPRFSPQEACRAVAAGEADLLLAVPSMYAAMARLRSIEPRDFRNVFLAVSGGEALPRQIYDAARERMGLTLLEGYGLTETSPVISVDLPWAHKVGTVGPPLKEVEVRILDGLGRPVAPGQDGELSVRSPFVMKGYYNRPGQTAAVIDADGWFRTGDIVRQDADGHMRITGRARALMIVGGENVYPREVEAVLEQHPDVRECAVIGVPAGPRGEEVTAFVSLQEGAAADEIALRSFCRRHLAGFKVPRRIVIGADLPRGPTGKILKRRLPELLG